jgi:hypothetical protein
VTRALILALLAATMLIVAPAAATAATQSFPAGCGLTGLVRTTGRPCPRVEHPRHPIRAGRTLPPSASSGSNSGSNSGSDSGEHADLFGISVGGIFNSLAGKALRTIVGWVVDGAAAALRFTAHLISETTAPSLESSWFSASYWRVAAIASVLTVPFLCAAAVHALVRADPGLLARAAFGYLPLAMLGVGIAAPLTTLVLSATDEMSAFVAAASSHSETVFLGRAATGLASASLIGQDPFLGFFIALVTIAAALALWIELLVRAAAVDVIVLMLPLFFAAMVWPARRVWAIRAIETLVALILAKFTIVAVLSLGGAAIGDASSGPAAVLTGAVLITLATLSPWALLRVLPMHEVAAAAAGGLGALPRGAAMSGIRAAGGGDTSPADWLRRHLARDSLSNPGDAAPASVAPESADSASFHPLTQSGLGVVAGDTAPAASPRPAAIAPVQEERPIEEAVQPGNHIDDEPMILGDEPE